MPEAHESWKFDPSTFEIVEETPASCICRTLLLDRSKIPASERVCAIKSASKLPEFSREPHDIVKELKILSMLKHPNVCELFGHSTDATSSTLYLWMPWIPFSLPNVLNSTAFSPHESPETNSPAVVLSPERRTLRFTTLAKSLIYQYVSAVAYLHKTECGIAHRDIKPSNAMITADGFLKLIDFGISWNENMCASEDIIWPERPDSLYFEVSSGPYRAPELLFGTRNYDPFAIDLWSLGATCAEFFTPLRFMSDEDAYGSDDSDGIDEPPPGQPKEPFIATTGRPEGQWVRDTLFDSTRGDIGLAWSIFQARGTPTAESWPTFQDLPHATKVSFVMTAPTNLHELLPNLPPESFPVSADSAFPSPEFKPAPLDLIHRFLVYPPSLRLTAAEALSHPWFHTDLPLVLPPGYLPTGNVKFVHELEQDSLEILLADVLSAIRRP
ncbi:kinase-like protein [Panus rudis PR-1116 ss-1]|nr:kinase-like protein [Panus rudis PR-1116 ss-1]